MSEINHNNEIKQISNGVDDKTKRLTFASVIVAGGLIAAAVIFSDGLGRFSGGTASIINSKPGVKEFNVVMKNNRYDPSVITANLGDRVIINFTNRDNVAHAVEIPQFNATVPGGHVFPGQPARMEFVANQRISTDAAACGGTSPTDKTDDHGEELIIKVI